MRITLFWLVVGLMATAGTSRADESGQMGDVTLHARSVSSPSGPQDVRRLVGPWRVEETESPDDEEAPSGRFLCGIMLSVSNTPLFVKGEGTEKSPLKIYVRIAPFTYIHMSYWKNA
jgi:hypothetical protein